MPPAPRRLTGRREIGRYLASPAGGALGRVALVETRANCRPALAVYRDEARAFRAHGIFVLVESGDPADVVGFADASLFPYFGLPGSIDSDH
jgi:hypothetical protein